MRILVVEDDGSTGDYLKKGLTEAGYAVDLARNELNRTSGFGVPAVVSARRMEAADIRFLEGHTFDTVVLNGVTENFPGYNYLRNVLSQAVDLLAPQGTLFVGAVRDLDRQDDLRAAIEAYALASGNQAGLLRHDSSDELFVPRRFFMEWAAQCPVPVEIEITPCVLGLGNGPGTGGCTLHNPHYDFNDDLLRLGASYWVQVVRRWLPR